MASRIARIAFLSVLLLMSTHTAWAARGDIDPNYGEGAGVAAASATTVTLPGDRLVIASLDASGGFRVQMVDAAGRNVASFGDGGVVLVAPPAEWGAFVPEPRFATLAPNGDMIFVGWTWANGVTRYLVRLDGNGKPVTSFGTRGDGFIESAVTIENLAAFAAGPDGKIVIADDPRDSNFNCGRPARLQRLLADGQPDTTFGETGLARIHDLDLCNGASIFGVRADGSIVAGDGHTIVALDAAGAIDLSFGVNGQLSAGALTWSKGLLLPDGGLLVIASDESASSNDTVFLKFDRNGQPDSTFGAGTGAVTVDLGGRLLNEPSAHEHVDRLAPDPDGVHLAAQMSFSTVDGVATCTGIARLTVDGAPDAGFGRNGLTCLNIKLDLTTVQSNGAPLFYEAFDDSHLAIHRLLPDNKPSPGFLHVLTKIARVAESHGTAAVVVERLAGRDGAVSVNYATVDRQGRFNCYIRSGCPTPLASAGNDYVAASGRLAWASGDDSQHTVDVVILDDAVQESSPYHEAETFGVDFTDPSGSTFLYSENPTIYILDNDPPPPPTSSGGGDPTGGVTQGGGGAFSWAALLALSAQLLLRRRRIKPGHAGLGGLLQE